VVVVKLSQGRMRAGASMSNNVILIADDEPWHRLWMSQILHQAGFTCSAVADGESVVEYALALEPLAIVLDVELPGINGIQVAEQLRFLPNTRPIPIIFTTSYLDARDRVVRAHVERSDWLLKPFHPDDLIARIRRLAG
jgi:DNA-binding response OmpR family regulator